MKETILFGNGINRLSTDNISWENLLLQIKESRPFEDSNLPNTMIYERIILEKPVPPYQILENEFQTKTKIAQLLQNIQPNKHYLDLYGLNAEYYLTTNYDYGFLKSLEDNKSINLSTEDIYSIRREQIIKKGNNSNRDKHIWHIHGEVNKPASIMLGLDHYCGSIGKIDNYIKGGYSYSKNGKRKKEDSIENKFYNNSFNMSSWIELFFTTNIHIVGLSLEYSEIDLWWILNKRARLMKGSLNNHIKNKIYFYCDSITHEKKGLFESLDVEVIEIPFLNHKKNYEEFYLRLLPRLNKKIMNTKINL